MRLPFRPTSTAWTLTLLTAGLASNAFLSCGTNLVAFGVVAALTLRARGAAVIALAVWFGSQALGFTLFGYPREATTFAWGAAAGVATLVATWVAARCARRWKPVAFPAAFAAYELVLLAFALVTRSGLGGFAPAIVGRLLWSNALVALGACVLYGAAGLLESAIAARGFSAPEPGTRPATDAPPHRRNARRTANRPSRAAGSQS